jgi:hypothetical protein
MKEEFTIKIKRYCRLAGLTVLIFLLSLSCTDLSGEYKIKNFDLGKGRSIEILASEDAEVSQSFYYQVKVDQKILVPLFMICVGHDRGQLTFNTLLAKDSDLVGIFEQKHPQELLAIHDFRLNATWPGLLSDNNPPEQKQSGTLLLKLLQVEHQNIQLQLEEGRACE